MINFSSIYSFWWLLPIIIISIALAGILYYRNPKEEFPKWVSFLLALFRSTVFAVLGFLLLSPLVISWQTQIEKAKIILLTDNSKSMIMYGDSLKLSKENNDIISKVKNDLSDKYEVLSYSFGNEVYINAEDNKYNSYRTDIGGALSSIFEKYRYSNIGAIVLFSDGIYNVGNNPIYSSLKSNFPIYTLGFGDTITHHDIAITNVFANKTAYIKNKFPIEISVFAKMLKGKSSTLIIKSGKKIVHTKNIIFDSDDYFEKHIFYIEEKNAGLKTYSISIKPLDNERNTVNNSAYQNVDVFGSRKRVLLLYSAPHPDIAALQQSFSHSDEYQLEAYDYRKFKNNVKDYSIIILHQLPDNTIKSASLINKMRSENIPALYILGANSGVHYFNALNTGININFKTQSFLESTAIFNKDFFDFTISKQFANQLSNYPPLFAPYGKYKLSSSINTIFYQQIGSVATQTPLICVSQNSGNRNAFILGEGIWKWRMFDFMENKTHDNFDGFILKLVRFIGIKKTNKHFDVQWESQYNEFDEVEFFAQFYNASYEVVNKADIHLEIINNEGKSFSFAFNNNGDNYFLSAGRLPSGKYRFIAKLNYNNKEYIQKGKFYVNNVELEGNNLLANHNLLRNISENSGGEFFISKDYASTVNSINNASEITDIQSDSLQYKDLINYPFILIIIILLLTVEWFFRKQMGSY